MFARPDRSDVSRRSRARGLPAVLARRAASAPGRFGRPAMVVTAGSVGLIILTLGLALGLAFGLAGLASGAAALPAHPLRYAELAVPVVFGALTVILLDGVAPELSSGLPVTVRDINLPEFDRPATARSATYPVSGRSGSMQWSVPAGHYDSRRRGALSGSLAPAGGHLPGRSAWHRHGWARGATGRAGAPVRTCR
jgi:hypothetical protein